VERRYKEPLYDWDGTTPDLYLKAEETFFNVSESPIEKPGYNRYEVSNQLSPSESITLRTITLEQDDPLNKEDTRYLAGVIVPWVDNDVEFSTSSTDVDSIEYMGIVEEEITENIEFKNGAGSTANPIYSLLSVVWNDVSLGNITHSEDGTLSAEYVDGITEGCSYAELKYITKYHKWKVVSSDFDDDIQFLMKVVE
jgi:hypothetical protein